MDGILPILVSLAGLATAGIGLFGVAAEGLHHLVPVVRVEIAVVKIG